MKPIVVKLGGAALTDEALASGLLGRLADVACDAPMVVVHGGGAMVDEQLGATGRKSEKIDGLRVTPGSHLPVVVGVLGGWMNARLVAAMRAGGAKAVGLSLADGVLEVERADERLGEVGTPVGGDGGPAASLLGAGFTPVVSSIGADRAGSLLNVNADDAAAGVASALGASALVGLTDVEGVLDASGSVLAEIPAGEVEALIGSGVVQGGMAAKVRASARACAALGAPVVIGSWRSVAAGGSLERIGTRVVSGVVEEVAEAP